MNFKKKKLFNIVFLTTLIILTLILVWKEGKVYNLQGYLLVASVIIYLTWALLYHHFDKSLTLAVYLEYVLTAVLALILLIGVLL